MDEELRELLVHLYEFRFLLCREGGTILRKHLVIFLYQTLLHRSEFRFVAILIYGLDALEELVVEHHFIVCIIEHRDCLVGHDCKFGCRHALHVVIEHTSYSLECGSQVLQGEDGVVEVGHRALAQDVVDSLILLCYTGLDGGYEIFSLDLIEWSDLIFRLIRLEKGILPFCHNGGGLGCHHQCGSCN